MRSARRLLLTRLLLWTSGVLATTLLSVAMAHLGALMIALSTLCSGAPSTDITCLVLQLMAGIFWVTPSIAVFAWRSVNSRALAERRNSRVLGYFLQVWALLVVVVALVIISFFV